jgi:hypothetical protein
MDESTFPALDTHELAWAAGFFDGEGNIRVKRLRPTASREGDRLRGYAVIFVPQIDPRVLERFRSAVHLGKVMGPYAKSHKQPQWHYEVYTFEKVQAVVALLWRWLSPVKRQQASEVLTEMKMWHVENIRLRGNSRTAINAAKTHCKYGHPFDEANTRVYHRDGRPRRVCRACRRENTRRLRAQNGQSTYSVTATAVLTPSCIPPMTVVFSGVTLTDTTNGLTAVPVPAP